MITTPIRYSTAILGRLPRARAIREYRRLLVTVAFTTEPTQLASLEHQIDILSIHHNLRRVN